MSFKYAIVCDILKFMGYDFLENPREILEAIKNAGYDGADLPGEPERMNARELRSMTDSLGLQVPEVYGEWAYFQCGEDRDLAGPDKETRRRGIQYAKKSVDLAVELEAQFFHVIATQPRVPQFPFPDLPIKTLRKNFVESLKEICDYAGERGITILLEPINGYEAYTGVLTSVYEAISLIEELDFSNIGIQTDVFHMNIVEASIPDALRAAGKYVRHVHINETNRYSLGTGHADFNAILTTLKEIGFAGYLAVYVPLISQEVWQMASRGYGRPSATCEQDVATRPALKIHLERAIRYLKGIEEAVDLRRRVYGADASYCGNE